MVERDGVGGWSRGTELEDGREGRSWRMVERDRVGGWLRGTELEDG